MKAFYSNRQIRAILIGFIPILAVVVFTLPPKVWGAHQSYGGMCEVYSNGWNYCSQVSSQCSAAGGSFSIIFGPETYCIEGLSCPIPTYVLYWYACNIPDPVQTCATNPTMNGCPCTRSNACNTTSGIYSNGVCNASQPAACTCSNGSPGPYPSCPIVCTPNPSCAANTCTGSTCSDSCGNVYTGTRSCGCTPNPSCRANTCTGSTCSDSCGNVYTGTLNCSAPSLKICENSCSSGLLRSGQNFSMASGSTRNLVACYNTASDCSNSSGNVTALSVWTEGGNPTIYLSGSNPKTVTATTGGTETITATYSP